MIGPWLSGDMINLRPLRDSDSIRRTQWLNDNETIRLFAGSSSIRVYEISDSDRWRAVLEADLGAVVWAIETKDHQHIGDLDLHGIDSENGMARLTILIGDKAYWGRGYGSDALRTMLSYAFEYLGLESVHLRVFDFNTRAIKCYQRCGFTEVGCSPSDPMFGRPAGEVYMSITRDTFLLEESKELDAGAIHS